MTSIEFRSHMTVKLVQSMASDSAVVMAARVSTIGSAAVNAEADAGLINYLMRDRHGSPFEHNAFTFLVECPLFVMREIQRHRIASYNETSGRYRELEPVFYVPADDRALIQTGKPGAYTFTAGAEWQARLAMGLHLNSAEDSWRDYQIMLNRGIAREVARNVLPLSLYTSAFMTINARSLMNFLSLRTTHPDAHQPSFPLREIEMVAEQMEAAFLQQMPLTYGAWMTNGRVAP